MLRIKKRYLQRSLSNNGSLKTFNSSLLLNDDTAWILGIFYSQIYYILFAYVHNNFAVMQKVKISHFHFCPGPILHT